MHFMLYRNSWRTAKTPKLKHSYTPIILSFGGPFRFQIASLNDYPMEAPLLRPRMQATI